MTTDKLPSQKSTAPQIAEHPEYWMARGVGSEWNLTCLFTGEQRDLMPNISGFVRSREAGERVVALFGGRARLDYRPAQPNWIQVKVGVVEEHKPVLGRLAAASYACRGMLDADIIAWALDPEGKPGLQPFGLRAVDEAHARVDTIRAERDDLLRHRAASEAPGWTYQGPHSAGAHLSDAVVAGRVRMLMRNDLDHEAVCLMARDRIRDLSREVARQRELPDRVAFLEAHRDALQATANRYLDRARRSELRDTETPRIASGLTIAFHQHDWIPGFAAFLDDGTNLRLDPASRAFCVLNLGSILATVATRDVSPADVITFVAESMMHEILHAIEKWAGEEFSEERVEGLIERYRASVQAEPVEVRS